MPGKGIEQKKLGDTENSSNQWFLFFSDVDYIGKTSSINVSEPNGKFCPKSPSNNDSSLVVLPHFFNLSKIFIRKRQASQDHREAFPELCAWRGAENRAVATCRLATGRPHSQGEWLTPAQSSAIAAHDSSFFFSKRTDDIKGLKAHTGIVETAHGESSWEGFSVCSCLTLPDALQCHSVLWVAYHGGYGHGIFGQITGSKPWQYHLLASW